MTAFINAIEVLNGSGVTTNTFDPSGNLRTATDWTGTTTFTWDSENRLLNVASGLNGTETYSYAADGMRRQKVTSAQTNNFVWDGANVLQERSVSNVRLSQYTDYPGMWGGLASGRQGSTSSFYGFDSQSSTRILVSLGGVITDNYSYKAFGEELAQGQGPNAQYTNNPYRYVGQYGYYRDMISRIYIRARKLSTAQGTWISRDQMGIIAGDINLYRYVKNNVPNWIDPSGYICQLPDPWWCWSKPTCVDITNDYAAAGRRGDQLGSCASCVSASLCSLIEYCSSPVSAVVAIVFPAFPVPIPIFPIFLPTMGVTIAGCAEVVGPVACQNICMHERWKDQTLVQWRLAQQLCKPISQGGKGPNSYSCCAAQVIGEQTGYTECAKKCGGGLSILPQPSRISFWSRPLLWVRR